jgi:hypothetical protein
MMSQGSDKVHDGQNVDDKDNAEWCKWFSSRGYTKIRCYSLYISFLRS